MNKRIDMKEIDIQIISKDNIYLIEDFQSFQKDLEEFLKEDSLIHQEKLITKTFLWIEKSSQKLIGYLTICTDSIKLHNISDKLQTLLDTKSASFDFLPAIKIARVCVDNRYRSRGVGKLIITSCISSCLDTNKSVGCRFITLDSKHHEDKDKDPREFYKKFGFEEMKLNKRERRRRDNNDTTPMYLDLINWV